MYQKLTLTVDCIQKKGQIIVPICIRPRGYHWLVIVFLQQVVTVYSLGHVDPDQFFHRRCRYSICGAIPSLTEQSLQRLVLFIWMLHIRPNMVNTLSSLLYLRSEGQPVQVLQIPRAHFLFLEHSWFDDGSQSALCMSSNG